MATTTLLVEILVIGSLAQLWLGSVFLALVGPISFAPSAAQAEVLKNLAPILIVPFVSLAYALGWVVNFAAERTFKRLFEERWRNPLFPNQALEYEVARILYLQKGSSELGREFVLDRHILRVARANVFNFSILGLSLLLHWKSVEPRLIVSTVVLCMGIAALSFNQWRLRYRSYYKRLGRAAKILANEPSNAA